MLIYLIALILVFLASIVFNPKKNKHNRKKFIVFSFLVVVLISMFRNYTVGIDLFKYYYPSFKHYIGLNFSDSSQSVYETGFFYFLIFLTKISSNPQILIVVSSLLTIGVFFWFIYRNSDDVLFSVFLFICLNTWFMYMNILRQALAVAILLIAYEYIKSQKITPKRVVVFALIVLIATSFHNSAIIGGLLILALKMKFKKKEVFISGILLVVIPVFYRYIFSFVARIITHRNYVDAYLAVGDADSGFLSIYSILMYGFLFVLSVCCFVIKNKTGRETTSIEINSYSNDFYVYVLYFMFLIKILSTHLTIIGRLSYYLMPFVWLAIPRVISGIKMRSNRMLIKYGLYILYLFMFILIGYTRAASLYGTVPYEFFRR